MELGLLIDSTTVVCCQDPKAYECFQKNCVPILIHCLGGVGGKLICLFCKIMGKTLNHEISKNLGV